MLTRPVSAKSLSTKLRLKKEWGMSLIEIMVILIFVSVTLVVGINMVVAQESDNEKIIRKARDGLMLINNGVGAYVFDTGKPAPKNQKELSLLVDEGYFKKLPVDPWGHDYQYNYPAVQSGKVFDLFSLGPDGVVSDDDIVNWDLYGTRAIRYAQALEK